MCIYGVLIFPVYQSVLKWSIAKVKNSHEDMRSIEVVYRCKIESTQ